MGNSSSQISQENENIILHNNHFNVQIDIPDIRDYEFKLPENQISEISSQFEITLQGEYKDVSNNCIINNICYILYNVLKDYANEKKTIPFYPSSKYIEYIIKQNEYQNNLDSGISIRKVLKAINKYGIIPDNLNHKNMLNLNIFTNIFKIKYEKINVKDPDIIKNLLLDNKLVIFNLTIYSSIDNKLSKKNNLIPLPKKSDSVLGCLSAIVYGYDDNLKNFNIIAPLNEYWNSNNGKISYETFSKISNDIWVIDLILKKNYNNELKKLIIENEKNLDNNQEVKVNNEEITEINDSEKKKLTNRRIIWS